MTEPRLSARGGNGRVHASPELFDAVRPRRWKLDVTQLITIGLAFVASISVSWFAQQYQVKANTSDIARIEASVADLEKRKESTAVDFATLAAEIRTELRAIQAQLMAVDKRLERIETRR